MGRVNVVREEGADPLIQAHALLQGVDPWEAPRLEAALVGLLEASGLKPDELYQPIRVAVAGDPAAAGVPEMLERLGREETLTRLETALEEAR